MSRLSGVSARAIPACDIVLYPKLVFAAREMPQEMKSLGTTTLVIANQADESARAAADLFVELSLDVPEIARLAGFICPVQLLGLYTGLEKGADPDRPRNLSRFVVLEEGTKSHHASL